MSGTGRTTAAILRAQALMAALRDPETGCPWDVAQTSASIAPYAVEEAYEVVEAIRSGDAGALRDELGDLLLQVLFHARMAEERGAFDFADVAEALSAKLVRRHPHVFGAPDGSRPSREEVDAIWEAAKRRERASDGAASALDRVRRCGPPLSVAMRLQDAAAATGFEWPDSAGALAKLREEADECEAALAATERRQDALEDEIGDLLFAAAGLARFAAVDAETALIRANAKFERRFRALEARLREQDAPASLTDMLEAWNRVKRDAAPFSSADGRTGSADEAVRLGPVERGRP